MEEKKRCDISCVVPAYNEESNIAAFIDCLFKQLNDLNLNFEILIVDDCSTDATAEIATKLIETHQVKLLHFSRNFGKEAALSAGIDYAVGDAVILIDADFQHPVEVIPSFIEKWREGYEMVYGEQMDRDYMPVMRRVLSRMFYFVIAKISDLHLNDKAGDFRLMNRKVVEAIKAMPERKRLMKGLYSWVGFKSIGVPYKVEARKEGKSRFNTRALFSLGLDSLIAFSDFPLRVWSLIGFGISLVSMLYAGWIVTKTLLFGVDVPGWATLVVAVTFLGGLQLLSIGILGEYIGSIFNEVKQRPIYLVAEKYGFDDKVTKQIRTERSAA